MNFRNCIANQKNILMEGALGERLKREYHLTPDPEVALAAILYNKRGRSALQNLWKEYLSIAQKYQLPFLATTPTRRANQERVAHAGLSPSIISDNAALLKEIQHTSSCEMYVGGLMGCKGDAYTGEGALSQKEAVKFHQWQADLFAKAKVDFLYAGIMPVLSEAAGMAQAMEHTGIPYIISFTIQADGRLIDGTSITEAIAFIDQCVTDKPVCYMANCVHPSIVYKALCHPMNQNELVRQRFLGIQANTSPLPYYQLDGASDLKCSEPELLALQMMQLREISSIKIFGGCCGTDGRHMEKIAKQLQR